MVLCTIIFGAVSAILLFLLIMQKIETKNISKQLNEIKAHDTNLLIHSKTGEKTSAALINEINELLLEIQKIRSDHQKKSHALEQMMTNISHDLRTPLTSALGYIRLIQNSDIPEEEKLLELEIIEKRLIRLEKLINSFFEFSMIISESKLPEISEINVIAVLEESVANYYDDYNSHNRQIIINCDRHKIMLRSNRNMLLRIFDNLLGNALKHGSGDLTVTVKMSENVQIGFSNLSNDKDIDTEQIFDEFYTTDISRTKGNTGLGLAIVKQFTEMLGGKVSAKFADGIFDLMIKLPAK